MAHGGSTGIALPFLDHGTRRGWGVSVTPWPLFTPGKDPVPIVQEAGWAPGSVWTGAENLAPTRIRSPDRPARSQSLYQLSYPAQFSNYNGNIYWHLCFPFFHFSVGWCTSTQYSIWQTQHLVILIIIQASALSAVLHVIALTGNVINCSVKNKHKHEPTVKKKVTKKSLQQKEGHLPLALYCTKQRNKCVYAILSSPIDCIWTHSPQHPQISQNYHKPKYHYKTET